MASSKQKKEATNTVNTSVADPKTELRELLKRKAEIAESLAHVERQIFAFEGSYLQDTQSFGNVVHGWDRSLATRTSSLSATAAEKRARKLRDNDRIFSKSSITYLGALRSGSQSNGQSGH